MSKQHIGNGRGEFTEPRTREQAEAHDKASRATYSAGPPPAGLRHATDLGVMLPEPLPPIEPEVQIDFGAAPAPRSSAPVEAEPEPATVAGPPPVDAIELSEEPTPEPCPRCAGDGSIPNPTTPRELDTARCARGHACTQCQADVVEEQRLHRSRLVCLQCIGCRTLDALAATSAAMLEAHRDRLVAEGHPFFYVPGEPGYGGDTDDTNQS